MTIAPSRISHWAAWAALALVLCTVITTLWPYGGNPSALFHNDHTLLRINPPHGLVLLDEPAYDGMQYYAIASHIPALWKPAEWSELKTSIPGPYAYQRILLPVIAFILAFGQVSFLPWSFLFIQLFALTATALLLARKQTCWPLIVGLVLSPAAMLGLHFSLAEPLTIVLLTVLLARFAEKDRLDSAGALLLAALMLTREVNVFLIPLFALIALYKKDWKGLALLLIPAAAFVLLHTLIYAIFGQEPFLWSTSKSSLPFVSAYHLLSGAWGWNLRTFSSVALLFGFIVPAFVWTLVAIKRGARDLPTIGAALFLLMMLTTSDVIWGSITSIGRVITPVYPLFVFAGKHSKVAHAIGLSTAVIGFATGLGLALIFHPFVLS